MHRKFLIIAALLGGLSVILGAFTAHKLKEVLTEQSLSIFETGVRYQFYHVFALFAVGILYKEFTNKWLFRSGILFCLGIFFFSGSLYFLAFFPELITSGFKWLYLIAPLGGLCFIVGWIFLAIGLSKKDSHIH
jgi:uncharacterized membrane protein YgdD (TMEM256/DUF423 family)